ncbi:hypothetical protein CFOL_v3_26655 [Cephalotus follicularis]|uniref:Uncharacterized protein n=1 Tax=Cephalotus follicularis TaxID=3775 RepID=A0A1Q3CSH9_CEPFO|nr:hypothetical protein CFOL_v3_26655 [Cephalotus follicularis]
MVKKMKGVAAVRMESSPYAVYEDPKTSFKHHSLMQDYEELHKETETKRKKLEMMRQRKLTLSAEVRFLRQRYKQLMRNQTPKSQRERNIVQQQNLVTSIRNNTTRRKYYGKEAGLPPLVPRLDLNQKGKIYIERETTLQNLVSDFGLNQKPRNYNGKETVLRNCTPGFDLNLKERIHSGKESTTQNMTPVFDLNQISREEEELQATDEPMTLKDLKKSSGIGGCDEQHNDMKLSVCRNVGNGSNRAGKRKITWQDQVALRV